MENVDLVVGQRIRARRIARGLSQTELGNAIGVRFQQVQKYESGANRVSASRLWAIADVLGVEVGYFFDGITAAPVDAARSSYPVDSLDFLSDTDTVEMLLAYTGLPLAQKRAVLAFVKTLSRPPKPPSTGVPG